MNIPVAMIAAMAENRVIGVGNRLPWHLPADLQHFKKVTLGKPLIMGRKTWDSLGRPLPGRLNIVVSRQPGLELSGAEVYPDLPSALERAQQWAVEHEATEIMVIGGGQLYAEALPMTQRIYLTRVALSVEGDAFFPDFDESQWSCYSRERCPEGENSPAYAFEIWEPAMLCC